MTQVTNVQLIAQNNLRNVVRAVALNKWAIATTAYLTLKATLITKRSTPTT